MSTGSLQPVPSTGSGSRSVPFGGGGARTPNLPGGAPSWAGGLSASVSLTSDMGYPQPLQRRSISRGNTVYQRAQSPQVPASGWRHQSMGSAAPQALVQHEPQQVAQPPEVNLSLYQGSTVADVGRFLPVSTPSFASMQPQPQPTQAVSSMGSFANIVSPVPTVASQAEAVGSSGVPRSWSGHQAINLATPRGFVAGAPTSIARCHSPTMVRSPPVPKPQLAVGATRRGSGPIGVYGTSRGHSPRG